MRGARALAELGAAGAYRSALWRARQSPECARSRTITMLVVSDLRRDPRVERAARAAVAGGYEVTVVCPDVAEPRLATAPIDWGDGIRFRVLPTAAGQYVNSRPWLLGQAMFRAALEERPFAFHCHDLNTSVMGLAAARRVGALCVCDFHEWSSETAAWDAAAGRWGPMSGAHRRWFQLAESLVVARADAVITVSQPIADALTERTRPRRPLTVIRNTPNLEAGGGKYPSLRAQLGVRDDELVFLYQGGTGSSRRIEPVIEALAEAPKAVLVIRGPGIEKAGPGYRAVAERVGASARLHVMPPVPSADVVDAVSGADAGVYTVANLGRNYTMALPNKAFEYLAAGVPVIAADYPGVRPMIHDLGVGLLFDPESPRSIAAQMNRLIDDGALRARLRAAIPSALASLAAANEWAKLPRLYDALRAG